MHTNKALHQTIISSATGRKYHSISRCSSPLVNQSLKINFTIPKTETKLIIFSFDQHRNSEFSFAVYNATRPDFTGVKFVACQRCVQVCQTGEKIKESLG